MTGDWKRLLGPWPERVDPEPETVESVDCGSYIREKVVYSVEAGERVPAYVCVPKGLTGPAPAVFGHHQHASQFGVGKSEVVGLRGHPDQAYAPELAARGFVTIVPDALGFEERNWSRDGQGNVSWWEASTRLVRGQTLLAKCLHDITVALDHLVSRPDVDATRIGFLGHSYGGRMALWAPAFDPRIVASVSNCGCIPFRLSATHDTGLQAETVVPGFVPRYDLDDVIASYPSTTRLLISATRDDKWSRGAAELVVGDQVELALYDGGHEFTEPMRARAYDFLTRHL
ncbi:prolyl oligopeptidase family serine peptidase [Actinoplanes sp. LDG1-06]|uniref:Prolyl oligopeptidase family serine peptidase n=1 Tax=Paractinoplanes ovalisporus TaxID=2810368 RepID=A0ABS2A8J2_9ACTN|nr:prolyl oligopeptidase family serine peptidase [Actinoplanes ovalisporus]MBM2616152.1 prolyl oligopeptidase family serine peptidase [Actinoplanes ovalisporus]